MSSLCPIDDSSNPTTTSRNEDSKANVCHPHQPSQFCTLGVLFSKREYHHRCSLFTVKVKRLTVKSFEKNAAKTEQEKMRATIVLSRVSLWNHTGGRQLPVLCGTAHSNVQQRFLSYEYLIDRNILRNLEDDGSENMRRKNRKSWRPSQRFVDRSRLRVAGGRGGKASLSVHKISRGFKRRPDGGHGGDGGSVIIAADPAQQSLESQQHHLQAEKGTNGTSQKMNGRNGKNLIVRVPCGVVVKRILEPDEIWDEETRSVVNLRQQGELSLVDTDYDSENDSEDDSDDVDAPTRQDEDESTLQTTEDEFDESAHDSFSQRESVVLADLDQAGAHVVVALGGKGGMGSSAYARRDHRELPSARFIIQNAQPEPGEVAHLELELKLIADVGLVGFPNAGKSSLLRALSRATPVVAPYPFTTLRPWVGSVDYRDGFRLQVADIPGLIDGASEGRGKGFEFLRHVERTKALLYIVDCAGVDYRDPVRDLEVLVKEIGSYGDGSMMEHRALIVANKIDLIKHEERLSEIMSSIADTSEKLGLQTEHDILGISAGVTGDGLAVLTRALREVVTRADEDRLLEFVQ